MKEKPKNHRKALSRTFPAYHPKAGQPTYFPEKVCKVLGLDIFSQEYLGELLEYNPMKTLLCHDYFKTMWDLSVGSQSIITKHHTIRAGNKVKVGDTITFFVWSGRPYRDPQIVIAPPIEVKKVWDFEMKYEDLKTTAYLNGEILAADTLGIIAHNDGLCFVDFMQWFKYPSSTGPCQVICWSDVVAY